MKLEISIACCCNLFQCVAVGICIVLTVVVCMAVFAFYCTDQFAAYTEFLS